MNLFVQARTETGEPLCMHRGDEASALSLYLCFDLFGRPLTPNREDLMEVSVAPKPVTGTNYVQESPGTGDPYKL